MNFDPLKFSGAVYRYNYTQKESYKLGLNLQLHRHLDYGLLFELHCSDAMEPILRYTVGQFDRARAPVRIPSLLSPFALPRPRNYLPPLHRGPIQVKSSLNL
jgi:hypothetical protein